jgi:cytochrome c biogenesis protein CcmG/thiol:disulfide interchange protein DsbE
MNRILLYPSMAMLSISVSWGQSWEKPIIERFNHEHDTTRSVVDYYQPEISKCIGSLAPDFALWDCHAQDSCHLSQFKGKTLVLTFWTTTCRGCRLENPELNRIWDSLHTKDVEVLNISWEPASTIEKFLYQNPIHGRVGIVTPDDLGRPFTLAAHPLSFIVDRNGILRDNWFGNLTYDTILPRLMPILTE